ncbi:Rho GDP-dissociation inhibitor 1 [Linum perenne]
MSLAVSSSSNMGLDDNKSEGNEGKGEELEKHQEESGDESPEKESKHRTQSSMDGADDDDEYEDEDDVTNKLELGPQYTLKEQLEKDKVCNFQHEKELIFFFVQLWIQVQDDESLRKWKEQLLGSVDFENIGETLDPEVKILSLSIVSPDRADIVLSIPEDGKPKGSWFTLKEGSPYKLKFAFHVSNNIVSGLKYTNTVWKTGVKVDGTKEMLGTFSPQPEAYIHEMSEEVTPSGMFARGSYSARSKFVDDDNKCYLEINYSFDIRKEWAATT